MDITIGKGVEKLGSRVFAVNPAMSITVPDNVNVIGAQAIGYGYNPSNPSGDLVPMEGFVMYGTTQTVKEYSEDYNVACNVTYEKPSTTVPVETTTTSETKTITNTTVLTDKTELITTTTITSTETKFLGDLNDDKNIDSKDAVLVLKSYAESLVNNNATVDLAGDINKDGKVDSKDAVIILKYYAATLTGFAGRIGEFNK